MPGKCLMIQGTTSDAGKSTLVAALCRILKNQGHQVAPFKPQNMALNSAVTVDGGEIGRAQAAQAQACDLQPHTDMNPILLKPNTDTGAQVIIHGKVVRNMSAEYYHHYKTTAMTAVLESFQRLQSRYDVILVEGAGSPAEINLRERDIANMGFAEQVNCPVIIIADIDRGGVFAHFIGTMACLSETERSRVKGFVINRFRGDPALLQSGLDWLEKKTRIPVLGVLPYIPNLHLEAEDALDKVPHPANHVDSINIIVPALPRISNHTDFDALKLHPQVNFQFIGPNQPLPYADLIILPGSKNTRNDLEFLKQQNWDQQIYRHVRYGGKLLGICGGFQMLGEMIHDPKGFESHAGSSPGLGLLAMETTLLGGKKLLNVTGTLCDLFNNAAVNGYEIHTGVSHGPALDSPLIYKTSCNDGAISADKQIIGTYLHGLFDTVEASKALLQWAGCQQAEAFHYKTRLKQQMKLLAEIFDKHLNMAQIYNIINNSSTNQPQQ